MQRNKKFYGLMLAQFVGIVLVVAFIFIDSHDIDRWLSEEVFFTQQSLTCNLRHEACSIALEDGSTMTLDITPRGIPLMTPLTFSLTTTGIDTDTLPMKIYATNMDMGIHRFTFKKDKTGHYKATGILPTCIEGGMIWRAEIVLPEPFEKRNIGAVFTFKTDR